MMGVAIVFQEQTAFLQNATMLSNVLYFDVVRMPSVQVVLVNDSLVQVPWVGPLVAWQNISGLDQVLVYKQNQAMCANPNTACMYAPVVQQVRSVVETGQCSTWDQFNNGTQCQKTVLVNCLTSGVSGDFSGTVIPDPITLPSVNNMCGQTNAYGVQKTCVYQANNWYTFDPNNASWLDNRTRNVILSLALFNPGVEVVQSLSLVLEQDLSGASQPTAFSLSYSSVTQSSAFTGVMAFLVTLILIDLLWLITKAIKHPLTFRSWWVFYDLLLAAFLIGLLVFDFIFWARGMFNFDTGFIPSLGRPACQPNIQAASTYQLGQWFGVLFALSLVRLLRFTNLVAKRDLVRVAVLQAFETLFFAALLVFFVLLVMAAALFFMFGPSSTYFSNYQACLSAFVILNLGRDVALFDRELVGDTPLDDSPAATIYFIVVLFVVFKAVSNTVSAIVAVTYSNLAFQARTGDSLEREQASTLLSGKPPNSKKRYRLPGCRHGLARFFRQARVALLGKKRYDLVGPDTVSERLVAWSKLKDNVGKTFITYHEVEDAICRVDGTRRLRGLDPRQVRDIMRSCGDIHLYTIEQAKMMEKQWEETMDLSMPWVKRTAEDIALQCNRVPKRTKEEVTGKSVEAQQVNVEKALNQYDVAVSGLKTVLPLIKQINDIATEKGTSSVIANV